MRRKSRGPTVADRFDFQIDHLDHLADRKDLLVLVERTKHYMPLHGFMFSVKPSPSIAA
jgi:hypothetical protein